ncbi:MAG TPA: glycoside hydrolase family 44 protein [Verrucomicrobiae bacterium]|nr:glycoside hydrolase family 44 protein [Verrucomicrobiae bacterium]
MRAPVLKKIALFVPVITFLFCSLAASPARGDQIIYDNTLENGWMDWGWATHDYSNSAPVHAGSHSVSVTCDGYQDLYIAHDAADVSGFTNLVFWAHGGSTGGQKIAVSAHISGSQQPWFDLAGALPANAWTNVIIPLSALDAAGSPALDGFWIGSDSGAAIATFYLDDISLQAGAALGPNATNVLTIDAAANRHPISSLIYGVAFANSNELSDLNFTLNRSGGNAETSYNWQINAHNHAADWYFESIADSPATPGASTDEFVADSRGGNAAAAVTIPMIGWAPILGPSRSTLGSYAVAKYGPQTGTDPYNSAWGNGISQTNGSKPITWNDPHDANTPVDTNFQKGYVQHLVTKWGAATNGGVRFYLMDNEHSIWQGTHQDVHPIGATMREIRDDILAYASMVKSVDSNALVLGPEEWGWSGYFWSGYDQQWSGKNNNYNQAQFPDRTTNGGMDYMPWLLGQLHQHDTNTHQRLLDYFTLHCYPQSGEFGDDVSASMQRTRNRSTRQFWDTSYVDPSWINSVVSLIPRMKNWATNYPGTKIGVTEYNWGAEAYINGATAQADILGIFGRESLDLATRWTTPDPSSPTYLSLKMYRNYDNHKSTFGDTSVLASAPNPDNMAVFAAQRASDGALTVMVVSKYLTGAAPVVLQLTNFTAGGPAQVWQLNASNVIARLPDVAINGNTLQTVVPGQSVTLFLAPAPPSLNFTPGAVRPDGQVEFWLNGQSGGKFVLQSSLNLTQWTPVTTNVFSNSPSHFVRPGGGTNVFYRAVSAP